MAGVVMAGHVVVIGAGVYGAAVSAALRRRGARATVVDSGAPGDGTSGVTFSWLNSCGKEPRAYHDLNVAGMVAHRELAEKLSGDWYHEGGNLEWAAKETDRVRLRDKVRRVLGYGYEARWLVRAEALRLEPDLDPTALPDDEIAFFPREGWLEPVRMIGFLLAGAEVVRNDAVVGIDVGGERVRGVRLASGRRLAADAVVNCAGPRAAEVAALAGLTLPMRNTQGRLVYTSPVAVAVSRVIHAPRVHVRPDGAGRLLLHGHDEAAADSVFAAACELYPGIRAGAVESVRVGERPVPGDGRPVLGRVAALPGFHFAVSHSAATLCVHAGDLVAAEVMGADVADALAPFRFERFR
ncbi:NAD(P)/FAD-dependent oxidoreductase [Actinophytocola glycyrrhizae]|uniref:NAD(P)/FAD-dependent oxidoreductase n=1 Tax=Actinophytocola glycyrrhizae TaxID=2044873 RepID=A0ABV9S7A7_9PSEU